MAGGICDRCGAALDEAARLGERLVCPVCGNEAAPGSAEHGEGPPIVLENEVGELPAIVVSNEPALSGSPDVEPEGGGGEVRRGRTRRTRRMLGAAPLPERLVRSYLYLVCDREEIVLRWCGDGNGWYARTGTGFVHWSEAAHELPEFGELTFIEIGLVRRGALRLTHVTGYAMRRQAPLRELPRGDEALLEALVGPVELSVQHQQLVRQTVRHFYLPPVWRQLEEFFAARPAADS